MLNKNKLKGAIAAAGLTQKELAADLNMSENSFCSKMAGKSSFDIIQAYRICERLGIVDDKLKVEIFLSSMS